MILNRNHQGRTSRGGYTFRPLIQYEAEDFPPDGNYWRLRAQTAVADLKDVIGGDATGDWFDSTFPETSGPNWKEIAEKAEQKLHELSVAQGAK